MSTKNNFVDIDGNLIEDNLCVETDSHGLMCPEDKVKLDGIEEGATNTIIDSTLSSTSTNPVQNKVINTALVGKADKDDLTSHIGNKSNPHEVTVSQLGLTATKQELNHVSGTTSNIQTQLDSKTTEEYVDTALGNYYNKAEIDSKINETNNSENVNLSGTNAQILVNNQWVIKLGNYVQNVGYNLDDIWIGGN